MSRNRLSQALLLATLLLAPLPAKACQVPVFRYALERWPADSYRLIALYSDAEGAAEALAILDAAASGLANIELETTDLKALTEDEIWQVEDLPSGAIGKTSLLNVYYPPLDSDGGARRLCWSGPLTPENARLWTTTQGATRLAISEALLAGESAVWVLVEGDDPAQNRALGAMLETALRHAEETLQIPEGVIGREAANTELKEREGASMDDVLRSDIPLRIAFSHLVLSADAEEPGLRALLSGLTERRRDGEAYLFPVFGRGRMLDPLFASDAEPGMIQRACEYLCGACSCQVKSLNPGIDLLLAADWDSALSDGLVVVDRSLPPLEGVQSELPPVVTEPTEESPAVSRYPIFVLLLAVVLAVLGAGSYLILRTRGDRP